MIRLEKICKSYGQNVVFDNADLVIDDGETVVVCGPSGKGKTTLLRLIAGLEKADSGVVMVDKNRLSFAFQNNLLLENLNAYQNIAYGINMSKVSKQDLDEKIFYVSKLFECNDFLYQSVNTLSGGQKQRVSLARTFIKNPNVVLIDESFNSLDIDLKKDLIVKVLNLQKEKHFTLIYVSHDDRDIEFVHGRLIYVNDGKINAKED